MKLKIKKNKISIPDIKISNDIDATGLYCPAPMAMLKTELEEVKISEIVKIIADDPGFEKDLSSWCNSSGNELLFLKREKKGIISGYVKRIK
jgi:TusA-related sulfurtransferase